MFFELCNSTYFPSKLSLFGCRMSLQVFLSLILSDSIGGSCLFRELIEQVNGLDPAIQDVGIFRIGEAQQIDDAVQRIVDCVPEENPVIILEEQDDFISTNNSMRLRKASLFFVVGDYSDFVSVLLKNP
jgi:hypothetical protein